MIKFAKCMCSMIMLVTLFSSQRINATDEVKYESSESVVYYDAKVNEYEHLKELNKTLLSRDFKDFSDEELNVIINYKELYQEHILKMNELSDETLEYYGYSAEKINAIRNFDGSEEMLVKAASEVTLDGGFLNYEHSASKTTVDLVMEFSWEGHPLGSGRKDIFGVVWNAPLNATSDSFAEFGYKIDPDYIEFGYPRLHSEDIELIEAGTQGDYAVSSNLLSYNGKANVYWLYQGTIYECLTANSNVVDITGFSSYGYSSYSLTPPSISISGTGMSVGISFSKNVNFLDSFRIYI